MYRRLRHHGLQPHSRTVQSLPLVLLSFQFLVIPYFEWANEHILYLYYKVFLPRQSTQHQFSSSVESNSSLISAGTPAFVSLTIKYNQIQMVQIKSNSNIYHVGMVSSAEPPYGRLPSSSHGRWPLIWLISIWHGMAPWGRSIASKRNATRTQSNHNRFLILFVIDSNTYVAICGAQIANANAT